MKVITLEKYSPIISAKEDGDAIFNLINEALLVDSKIELDLGPIKSMATFCAKQIFGRLYLKLGSQNFFNAIVIKNATDDLKTIIRIGIQNAIDDSNSE